MLPCPKCGSRLTIGALSKKLERVRSRVTARQHHIDYATTMVTGAGNYLSLNSHTHSSSISSNHTHSLGNYTLSADCNWSGDVRINEVEIDTCADCGTLFGVNADEVKQALQNAIYKLDPLGSLAEIVAEDGPTL